MSNESKHGQGNDNGGSGGEENFSEYRIYLMKEIGRLDGNDKAIMAKLETVTQIIIELKVKAAIAGAAAGIVTSLVVAWMVKRL